MARAFSTQNDADEAFAEAEQRAREAAGKISRRRYKRWVNDRLLKELSPELDWTDLGVLFAPPPWGKTSHQTPFELVTETGGSAAAAAWEPFRNNVDMDYQAKVLKELGEARHDQFGKDDPAFIAWRTVDYNARNALKRNSESVFLDALEDQLLEFKRKEKEDELVVEVPAPQHRLLLHGLSQFHGLVSQTSTPPPTSLILVRISKPSKCKTAADKTNLNLRKFLRDVRQPAARA